MSSSSSSASSSANAKAMAAFKMKILNTPKPHSDKKQTFEAFLNEIKPNLNQQELNECKIIIMYALNNPY